MSIEELEKCLPELRKKEGQKYSNLSVTFGVAKRIHEGKNYRFESMFLYLDSLGYMLELNGEVVENMEALGNTLTIIRENKRITWENIYKEAGLPRQQASAIEHGKGYYRSSLIKYLKVVDASFGIKSMIEYFNLDN